MSDKKRPSLWGNGWIATMRWLNRTAISSGAYNWPPIQKLAWSMTSCISAGMRHASVHSGQKCGNKTAALAE